MKICIIDHQPIFILGLERYIKSLFDEKMEIESCQSLYDSYCQCIENYEYILVNLELYTHNFLKEVEMGKLKNPKLKLFGLVDPENLEILIHAKLMDFNALVLRSALLDELKLLFSFSEENRKYYSPEIIEFLNNNMVSNKIQINYE